MKNKKRIALIMGIFLAIFIIIGLFIPDEEGPSEVDSEQAPDNQDFSTSITQEPSITIPEEEVIKISGVELPNFYKDPVKIFYNGSVLIEDNDQYQILYFAQEEQFRIVIVSSPFDLIRKLAEKDFLDILNLNEAQACSLFVTVATPQFANPDYAGEIYGLSFCE